ncbi:MAG: hypothetical protein KGL53_11455, partial [Elusimicrobia bacterium]|nr:hypothetical protein [Elusimicrobiota bacterium]
GVIGPLNLTALSTGTGVLANQNITIAAGTPGQVYLRGTSAVGASVGSSQDVNFLKLQLWSQGGNAQVTGLRLTLLGNAPAPQVNATIYQDGNGDGVYEPGVDYYLGQAQFSGSVPPSASITFYSTQTVTASTGTLFINLFLNNVPAGDTVGVGINAPSAFTFLNGSLAASAGPFPVQSGTPTTQFSLSANPGQQGYPAPAASPSAGGYDTGLFINAGQKVNINANGTWQTGGFGPSSPDGIAGQSGGLAAGLPIGALVARIGGGNWFLAGSSATFIAPQSGSLALAMNDTYYFDNFGSLLASFSIVPSTVTHVWLGDQGFGPNASVAQNWSDGQIPQSGETVEFGAPGSTSADCYWDIFQANVGAFKMDSTYGGT